MRYQRISYRYGVRGGGGQHVHFFEELSGVPRVARQVWRPAADVYETADALNVTVELAGVDPKALTLLLFDDALVVEGHRRLPRPAQEGQYQQAEIREGHFRLEVMLTARILARGVRSRYQQGLLYVRLPKLAEEGRDGI